MTVVVETRDCASLTDTDLDELANMGGAFDIGAVSKAKEDWVLFTSARISGKLNGFTFSTLERIGGTPCVLLGMMSVKRTAKRDAVLKGLMTEAYHRALMAFPDEDVVVGSRFATADGLEAMREIRRARRGRLPQQRLQPEADLPRIAGHRDFAVAGECTEHRRRGVASLTKQIIFEQGLAGG